MQHKTIIIILHIYFSFTWVKLDLTLLNLHYGLSPLVGLGYWSRFTETDTHIVDTKHLQHDLWLWKLNTIEILRLLLVYSIFQISANIITLIIFKTFQTELQYCLQRNDKLTIFLHFLAHYNIVIHIEFVSQVDIALSSLIGNYSHW